VGERPKEAVRSALLRRLVRIGDIDQTKMKLDFVLWLKIRGFLGASSPDPGVLAWTCHVHQAEANPCEEGAVLRMRCAL